MPPTGAPGSSRCDPPFRLGQRVAVNIGGCVENRTEGTIHSIRALPELTLYEVRFSGYARNPQMETLYMAGDLIAVP